MPLRNQIIKETNKKLEGKMDLEEQERNVIFVYQVPLKQKQRPQRKGGEYSECYLGEDNECYLFAQSCLKVKNIESRYGSYFNLVIFCKLFDIIGNYKRIGDRLCF